jgi:hypothetical protein
MTSPAEKKAETRNLISEFAVRLSCVLVEVTKLRTPSLVQFRADICIASPQDRLNEAEYLVKFSIFWFITMRARHWSLIPEPDQSSPQFVIILFH